MQSAQWGGIRLYRSVLREHSCVLSQRSERSSSLRTPFLLVICVPSIVRYTCGGLADARSYLTERLDRKSARGSKIASTNSSNHKSVYSVHWFDVLNLGFSVLTHSHGISRVLSCGEPKFLSNTHEDNNIHGWNVTNDIQFCH